MKYQITVRIEIETHPLDRAEQTFNDLMSAVREGVRLNHRIASRVIDLRLLKCRLIEPERENAKLMGDKANDC